MVADHVNYLTFEDPGAVNTVRRALKLAEAGDLHGAAEAAGVDPAHAQVVSDALRKGMRFSLGAEVDNDPRARPDAQNIIDAMRPDGIIRCVSFLTIEHPEKGPDFAWSFDDDDFASIHESYGTERLWESYVAKLLDDLEKLPAQVAGNFYSPARLGGWPPPAMLEAYEDRLLQVCHTRKLAIEINTRFLYRETSEERKQAYMEANARLARKAQALGVGIAVGSDAHSPRDQGNQFDVVLRMLDNAGINELVFPVGGRLARVALRATREQFEAHTRSNEKNVPGSSITGLSRAELGLPEQIDVPSGRAGSRARATAAKRGAGSPARTTKRASAGSGKSSGKSSSKRTADSTESSTQAKAARTETAVGEPASAAPSPKPAKAPAKPKSAAKSADAKPAAKGPAAKSVTSKPAASKSTAVKTPAPKAASRSKTVAKAAPARKVAEKSKPAAKPVKTAEKAKSAAPAHKKTPAKSAAKPALKTAAKKSAKKSPAKPASRAVAHPKSPAKSVKKKPTAKKSSKPAAHAVKKRPAPKRR
ncbi:MAG TPA: hypothetical protein VN936_09290 [Candidatus Acidoferrum sp.]|nr:hypothetical protein [Candidatus Acidoferrum sp.]